MTKFTNYNDIEANNIRLNDITYTNKNTSNIFCLKFTAIFFILVIGLPITFCDIYYAYNDHSCVNSYVDRISINLKDYLQVSGLLSACFLFVVIFCILTYKDSLKELMFGLGVILYFFINIFNLAWNIIGGVIFWGHMDNSLCSNNVFNYVFASLIIKYVCIGISLLSNKSNKD